MEAQFAHSLEPLVRMNVCWAVAFKTCGHIKRSSKDVKAMNQHLDPKGSRPGDPVNFPAEPATTQRVDPLAAQQPRNEYTTTVDNRRSFGSWPILIVLLAGLVLALLVWLPSGTDTSDTATQPATTEQTTTPPADGTTTPDTAVTPTPDATPVVPDTTQQAPATETPATGETQPQTDGATPNNGTTTTPATP
jgi:hypothetical protein